MKRVTSRHRNQSIASKRAHTESIQQNRDTRIRYLESIQNLRAIQTDDGKLYPVVRTVGEGVFGLVFSVVDDRKIAAKVMKKVSEDKEQWKKEIKVLQTLAATDHQHPNLLKFLCSKNLTTKIEKCASSVIFTDLLGPSLFDILYENQQNSGPHCSLLSTFPIESIKIVGKHILDGMIHLEQMGIFHLDLKPENIYFPNRNYSIETKTTGNSVELRIIKPKSQADLQIRIGDFGCSKFHVEPDKVALVQTQNYRSPEIFMGLPFSTKSDVWSFGAILCEMYTSELLFYGNATENSESVQFELMQAVTGQCPTMRMWRQAVELKSESVVEDDEGFRMAEIAKTIERTTPLHLNIRSNDFAAVPLFKVLSEILIFDPVKRPSFKIVRQKPFFTT